MTTSSTPLNAETAYLIAAVCLFSSGHWIGGLVCLGLAFRTGLNDRKALELSNLPFGEAGSPSDLPPVEAPAPLPPAGPARDPWTPDAHA